MSAFGIAKQVLIDGSKAIFKFGILGTIEHGFLSPLEFLYPSVRELDLIQDLGSGGVTTRMFP